MYMTSPLAWLSPPRLWKESSAARCKDGLHFSAVGDCAQDACVPPSAIRPQISQAASRPIGLANPSQARREAFSGQVTPRRKRAPDKDEALELGLADNLDQLWGMNRGTIEHLAWGHLVPCVVFGLKVAAWAIAALVS
jgi:hypothetical protein